MQGKIKQNLVISTLVLRVLILTVCSHFINKKEDKRVYTRICKEILQELYKINYLVKYWKE